MRVYILFSKPYLDHFSLTPQPQSSDRLEDLVKELEKQFEWYSEKINAQNKQRELEQGIEREKL